MRIVAVSDLHGWLPKIPECDLLIVGGDICPVYNHEPLFQCQWIMNEFSEWLKSQPAKEVVGVWGNHDLIADKHPHMLPTSVPWKVLTDDVTVVGGLKIYGSPWQLPFFDWAFNMPEEGLEKKYARIPDDTNIIISHGPPHGYGDLATAIPSIGRKEMEHVGSPSLTKRILEIKPILTITGHIHGARGVYDVLPNCKIINASVLNEKYIMVYKPVVIDVEDGKIVKIEQ